MIEYKGYTGWYEYDEEDRYFRGKVCNIEYPINFSGHSIESLTRSFQHEINNYLAMCKKEGEEAEKPSPDKKNPYYRIDFFRNSIRELQIINGRYKIES